MKDRRPRKLKKELKRRFEKVQSIKMVRTALVTMSSAFQMAAIMSRPTPSFLPAVDVPSKAMASAQLAMHTAEAIANILNESPKNWREA